MIPVFYATNVIDHLGTFLAITGVLTFQNLLESVAGDADGSRYQQRQSHVQARFD